MQPSLHHYRVCFPIAIEGIPPDGTPIEIINTIHVALIIIMDIMAIVGVTFAIVCLVFNIVFRNKRLHNTNHFMFIG